MSKLKKKAAHLFSNWKAIFFLAVRKKKPVIIIMVDGGLCSVMTKYVLGEWLKKNLGCDVRYDLTWFDRCGMDCDGKPTRHYNFSKIFPLAKMEIADQFEIDIYKKNFYYYNSKPYKYNNDLMNLRPPIYIDGYAENWRYFYEVENSIKSTLNFSSIELDGKNSAVLEDIRRSEVSIAVHIRRGDYVSIGLCWLGRDYYLSAINRIADHVGCVVKVYFFSDDMAWVKDNLLAGVSQSFQYMCVEINGVENGYLDLYLISQCTHQVSSNSSFGYWGGLLNKNPQRVVIIPDKWNPNDDGSDVLEDGAGAHDYPGFIRHSV